MARGIGLYSDFISITRPPWSIAYACAHTYIHSEPRAKREIVHSTWLDARASCAFILHYFFPNFFIYLFFQHTTIYSSFLLLGCRLNQVILAPQNAQLHAIIYSITSNHSQFFYLLFFIQFLHSHFIPSVCLYIYKCILVCIYVSI